jgi:hypothetical protein
MKVNTKRSILAVIAVLIVLFFSIRACQSALKSSSLRTIKEISDLDSSGYSRNIPREYADLFLNKKGIVFDSSVTSKHRNLVSEFHNEQFYIQICKLDTDSLKIPLNKIVKENNNLSEMSSYTYYVDASTNKQFQIKYKLGAKEKVSDIYLTLYGDSTQILKNNDTVVYYYSNFENFSIRFQKESKIDIYGKVKDNFKKTKVPLEIMFLKRNNNLYFILMSNKNYSAGLDLYALYNLIIK